MVINIKIIFVLLISAKTSKSRRTSDIISMLVNVYGSKELFVNEYRTLLADRLLSQFSYNTEKEIRYLELLKLRWSMTYVLLECKNLLRGRMQWKCIFFFVHNLKIHHFNDTQKIHLHFWLPWSMCIYHVRHLTKENIYIIHTLLCILDIVKDAWKHTLSHFIILFFFITCEMMKITVICVGLENHSYITVKSCWKMCTILRGSMLICTQIQTSSLTSNSFHPQPWFCQHSFGHHLKRKL